MPEIVVTEFMDEEAVRTLEAAFPTLYDPGLVDRREELLARLADCRALVVRNRTRVDRELLAAAPRLEVVGRLGVGLDNIDLEACRARGVEVRPATGANEVAVAEYVIAVMLVLLRGAFTATADVVAGRWPRESLVGREAAGRCLGLVGYGRIARQVAARARALGMTVAAHDPLLPASDPVWAEVARLGLDELLAAADVVSLHLLLTADTRNLLDRERLARMKPGAVLVNTARGGIVDEKALADALRAGRLGGAALDVFGREPLDAEAGRIFADVPNLILTPHIAGITVESNRRVSEVTARNVLEVLRRRARG